jgi:hypothetical protein
MDASKKNLILSLGMIIMLSGFTYWHFKSWRKPIANSQKIEFPKIDLVPEKEGYKEFISPDGKLKLKYPADWIEIDAKTLESYAQSSSEGVPLLLAQGFRIDTGKFALAFLTAQELNSEEKKGAEEIIEDMKNKAKEKGDEIEISKLEIKDGEASFETRNRKKDGPVFLSKEKIILDNKIYLVSFFTFEKDWLEFEREGEEIINSVQFSK